MNKKIVLLACILLITGLIQAEKVLELDMVIPGFPLFTQNSRYFLIASPKDGQIFLFDRQTLKQTLQFGKIGEGPGEFVSSIRNIQLSEDKIYVNSMGRLSTFVLKGRHLKDQRMDPIETVLGRVGNHFLMVGPAYDVKLSKSFMTASILDQNLKPVKRLFYEARDFGQINFVNLYEIFSWPETDTRHIIVGNPKGDGDITVYDGDGQQIATIRHPFEKTPISAKRKNILREQFLTTFSKQPNQTMKFKKENILIPDLYPPFSRALIDGNLILSKRYETGEGIVEYICFNLSGDYLGKIKHPKEQTGVPYKGYFYNIIENEETENYELHRWPIGKPQK